MESKYPPMTPPRLDLRKGVTDLVVLMISRRQVEQQDLASVLDALKLFTATREDAWRYRGQMSLVVDGYNHDPRDLVDIPEVRSLLKRLGAEWPYWGFFFFIRWTTASRFWARAAAGWSFRAGARRSSMRLCCPGF
jgi:hypothetical protein